MIQMAGDYLLRQLQIRGLKFTKQYRKFAWVAPFGFIFIRYYKIARFQMTESLQKTDSIHHVS